MGWYKTGWGGSRQQAWMQAAAAATLDVSKLFAVSLYPGTSATQTIPNGIDLLGKGGAALAKSRTNVATTNGNDPIIFDSARGTGIGLQTDQTLGDGSGWPVSFLSNGVSIGSTDTHLNNASNTYVLWSFAQDPRFFKIVTFTADASGGATFDTGLAVGTTLSIGQIEIKSRSVVGPWPVYHRSLGTSQQLFLNTSAAAVANTNWLSISGSVVTVASGKLTANATYVAYCTAHDTASDGVVQCGSGNVTLPFTPQYIEFKDAGAAGNWFDVDSTRGFTLGLNPNLTNAEATQTGLTASGKTLTFSGLTTPIWRAIRSVGG